MVSRLGKIWRFQEAIYGRIKANLASGGPWSNMTMGNAIIVNSSLMRSG